MKSNFIVGLDIGTSTIKVALAENKNGRPTIRTLFKEPSVGVRKGTIIDLAETSPAISRALGEVKKVSKKALKTVYVNIGTPQIRAQNSRGIVAVSRADSEIYQDDIDRAVKASQAVNAMQNRIIVHNVTREYVVDGVGDISDPLGLSGNRLEVDSIIIDAFAPHVKSVMRAVELAGGHLSGLVSGPLIASKAVLSKGQRDLGVVVVDIGFGTTSMSVYEENKLIGIGIFPVGAGNITNDLAVGLKIPVPAAEAIKINYGYAVAKDINPKETIDLKKFVPEGQGNVSRRFVADIIESRLAEIFEFVNNELRLLAKSGQLAGGVVLVGGGAKLPGVTELARRELKLSSQIGLTLGEDFADEKAFPEAFEDPEFVGALGLVSWGAEKEDWKKTTGSRFSPRKIIRYFLP